MHVYDKTAIFDFNPRLREGGDYDVTRYGADPTDFNPRLREGGDGYNINANDCKFISIHASAREATDGKSHRNDYGNFNPRLREGGDKPLAADRRDLKYFNPRLREGGDYGSNRISN